MKEKNENPLRILRTNWFKWLSSSRRRRAISCTVYTFIFFTEILHSLRVPRPCRPCRIYGCCSMIDRSELFVLQRASPEETLVKREHLSNVLIRACHISYHTYYIKREDVIKLIHFIISEVSLVNDLPN